MQKPRRRIGDFGLAVVALLYRCSFAATPNLAALAPDRSPAWIGEEIRSLKRQGYIESCLVGRSAGRHPGLHRLTASGHAAGQVVASFLEQDLWEPVDTLPPLIPADCKFRPVGFPPWTYAQHRIGAITTAQALMPLLTANAARQGVELVFDFAAERVLEPARVVDRERGGYRRRSVGELAKARESKEGVAFGVIEGLSVPLNAPPPRLVPDIRLAIRAMHPDGTEILTDVMVEYDRTDRPAKNRHKFVAWETFLVACAHDEQRWASGGRARLVVIFVTTNAAARSFARVAGEDMRTHRVGWGGTRASADGRSRIFFLGRQDLDRLASGRPRLLAVKPDPDDEGLVWRDLGLWAALEPGS